MVRAAREGHVVPLLADRDLRATGVAVTMFGESVKVAAGPAAVALVTGAPLFPVSIHYERLPSSAPSRWGIVIRFHPEIRPERGLSRAEQLVSMMQRCTNALALGIRHHPEDWHMLQSIFDGDLTPQIPAARAAETAALRASEKREARPGQERRGRKPEEFPAGGNS
jgi:KDO2-lipid IV(A) lauroyltransferase